MYVHPNEVKAWRERSMLETAEFNAAVDAMWDVTTHNQPMTEERKTALIRGVTLAQSIHQRYLCLCHDFEQMQVHVERAHTLRERLGQLLTAGDGRAP